LQIVISRWRGEKRVSSMPYVVSVKTANNTGLPAESARLRVGAQVPVPTTAASDGKTAQNAFIFKEIGTSIDVSATPRDDGRYELNLSIVETSLYGESSESPRPAGPALVPGTPPILRSYQSTNFVILRDGQSSQFTAATDPLTGDVIRVEVTMKMAK
jgi:hypothetical protein